MPIALEIATKPARHGLRRISKNYCVTPYVESLIKEVAKARGSSDSAVVEELVRSYGKKMVLQAQKEMLALASK
jgi:hypothetical protein